MSEISLVRVRLQDGRYVGLLTAPDPLEIELLFEGEVIGQATVEPEEGRPGAYRVQADVPATVIGSGVRVLSLKAVDSGELLDRVTLMAGAPLEEDIRAEVALLRDELELLKRAFRKAQTGA